MDRDEFDLVRPGITMTGIASTWAICVSWVEAWHTRPIVVLTVVLCLLAMSSLVHGLVQVERQGTVTAFAARERRPFRSPNG